MDISPAGVYTRLYRTTKGAVMSTTYLISDQINAGSDAIVIRADTCCDKQCRALFTQLPFGGRFGHFILTAPYTGRREAHDHDMALRIDRQIDWHRQYGRTVTVIGHDYTAER